jgi:hypothetical protein
MVCPPLKSDERLQIMAFCLCEDFLVDGDFFTKTQRFQSCNLQSNIAARERWLENVGHGRDKLELLQDRK